jgi:hypothetical protein
LTLSSITALCDELRLQLRRVEASVAATLAGKAELEAGLAAQVRFCRHRLYFPTGQDIQVTGGRSGAVGLGCRLTV